MMTLQCDVQTRGVSSDQAPFRTFMQLGVAAETVTP